MKPGVVILRLTKSRQKRLLVARARSNRSGFGSRRPLFTADITAYLQNGGTLEHSQQIAAHESPRTTKLYDRTTDQVSLDEIERIAI